MNTLPSRAYSVRPFTVHPTVVTSWLFEAIGDVPVFCSRKQPVPYVFFVSPGDTHIWPKSAACWSPAIPAIGRSASPRSAETRPYTSDDERTSGRTLGGTLTMRRSSSSQASVWMLNNIVRDALLTSVRCTVPPVRFHTSHESTVPNARCPCSAPARAPGTLSRIQAILLPEK